MSNCGAHTVIANDVRVVTGLLDTTNPVSSVTYDGSNRPTQVVYNTSNGTETVNITYPNGDPVIGGVEYKNHVLNIWDGKLTPADDVSVTIPLANGFSTQQIDVSTATEIVNTGNRVSIAVRSLADPTENQILYYDSSNAVSTSSWALFPREGITLDVDTGASVWLLASSGTIDVRVLEVTRT